VRSELQLPRPRTCAILVLAFLGFGVLIGKAASSPLHDTLAAAARPQLKVVLPTAAVPPATAPTTQPSSSNSEPPASEPEATPTTQATSTAASTAAAPATEPSASQAKPQEGAHHAAAGPATALPAIKHVFVIMLSQQPYAAAFGPESKAGYLAHTLERSGELLVRYDAVAHEQLANELALVSGQGPTEETALNCPAFADIAPATPAADEQLLGHGCVYPASTRTLAGQLTAKHLSWRAYVQSAQETGASTAACSHPAPGAADPSAAAGSGASATYSDPFVYFHSIIDTPACAGEDVQLSRLHADLTSASSTPSFSYIAPDRCDDGNPTPCSPGAPAGMGPADAFLSKVVPEIIASPAYKQSGLLVITVDEAPSSGEFADSSSCCGQPRFPNLAAAASSPSPRGGGTVGALLLSPFVKAGSTNQEPFNHFSLLRTVEDLFGLAHIGYAALPAVKPFEPGMFLASKN
jgi:hypothetical protein